VLGLGLRRVRIIEWSGQPAASDNAGNFVSQNATRLLSESDAQSMEDKSADVLTTKEKVGGANDEASGEHKIHEHLRLAGGEILEGDRYLREQGYELSLPLKREDQVLGWMLVDAAPDALTYDVRSMLELLAGQVAIAIADCRLVEENVRLERQVAHGERLAALGQMAATVAHEIRNPLSAIKSIAQVMREDDDLKNVYQRDLSLIISETDRLGQSVSQMLNFARRTPHEQTPHNASELVHSIIQLFSGEAAKRGVRLKKCFEFSNAELDGACAAALRDALSNLILNAVQATQPEDSVSISGQIVDDKLILFVQDEGQGIAIENQKRIWEPFFTTRQRGTGLGLAIVRKRIEEVGGTARLLKSVSGTGARFELSVPLRH
jgi:signal transduction histidine kinase